MSNDVPVGAFNVVGHGSGSNVLNFGSDSGNISTSVLKGLKSPFSRLTVLSRPAEEAFQVRANILDRMQIESTVRAKNRLL